MTSNNVQTSQVPEAQSNFDYSTISFETFKNFKDFNNMFRRMDDNFFTPCDIASVVVDMVRLERDEAKADDVIEWYDNQIYFQIRCTIDMQKLNYANDHGLQPPHPIGSCDNTNLSFELRAIHGINEYRVNQAYRLGLPPRLLDTLDSSDDEPNHELNRRFVFNYGSDSGYSSESDSDSGVSDIED